LRVVDDALWCWWWWWRWFCEVGWQLSTFFEFVVKFVKDALVAVLSGFVFFMWIVVVSVVVVVVVVCGC
jgi:hypothetical protein